MALHPKSDLGPNPASEAVICQALIRIQDPLKGLKLQMHGPDLIALDAGFRCDMPSISRIMFVSGRKDPQKDVPQRIMRDMSGV